MDSYWGRREKRGREEGEEGAGGGRRGQEEGEEGEGGWRKGGGRRQYPVHPHFSSLSSLSMFIKYPKNLQIFSPQAEILATKNIVYF